MIPISLYLDCCVILSPGVGFSDSILLNMMLQRQKDLLPGWLTKQLWLLLGCPFCSFAYLVWGKPDAILWAAFWRGPHGKHLAKSQRGPEACQGPHLGEHGSGHSISKTLRWFGCSLVSGSGSEAPRPWIPDLQTQR